MAETELPPTLVVELLESLLGTNDNSLQTIVNSAPISSLIDNLLQQQLSARQHSTIDSAPSDHPLDPARSLLLQLFLRLANFSGTISLPRFALILAVYGPTNRSIIQGFVERVFDHDERLLLHLGEKGPKLFAATAALPGPHSVEQLHQIVAIHCALAADSHPTVTSEYGQNQSVYSTLSHFYAQLDLSDLLSLPTATIKSSSDASIRIRTKAQLLETFHHLLDVSFLTPLQDSTTTTDDKAGFVMELDEMLAELLSAAAKEKAGNEDKTFFCNASLLRDLEFYYDISGTLESSLGRNLDRMGRDVLGRFKSLVGSSDPNDGYEILLGTRPAQRPNGKSPEVVDNSSSLDDLTPAITQILDLFPNHDAAFITRCLLHPRFDRSAELVIAALLEDDLPSELREDYSVRVEDEEATPVPAAITRRNVFDDEKIDMAKLTRGKATKSSADTLLSDKQFMTDSIKAAIIARAEAESSDEEGEEGEAFLEDFDDGRVAFKVRDDNDENEESVEEVLKPVAVRRRIPSPYFTLSDVVSPAPADDSASEPNHPSTRVRSPSNLHCHARYIRQHLRYAPLESTNRFTRQDWIGRSATRGMANHDGTKRQSSLILPCRMLNCVIAEEEQDSFATRIRRESSSAAFLRWNATADRAERERRRRRRREGRKRRCKRWSGERTRRWWKVRLESTAAWSGPETCQGRLIRCNGARKRLIIQQRITKKSKVQ